MTNPDPQGSWELFENENGLEIVGVHAVVLHTGKVLYWCFDKRAVGQLGKDNNLFQQFFNDPNLGSYQIWDPVTQKPVGAAQPIGRNSFCAGQCALADGTIIVAGGQDGAGGVEVTGEWDKYFAALGGTDRGALKDVHTYDPVSDKWTRWPDMADGRYYPTCQILGDGTAFVAGGLSNLQQWVASNSNFCENDQFETFPPGELFAGPTPQQKFQSADQYPIIRLLPGSHKLFVHVETQTTIFDLDASSFVDGAVFSPPAHDALGQHVGRQTYPMQTGHVLLPQKEGDPPRILIVGGSIWDTFNYNAGINGFGDFVQNAPAVLGAFIFEFSATSPIDSRWRLTKNPPTTARLLADTVLLPDGTVFVVNGIKAGAAAGHSKATAFDAEIFDPETETFTAVKPNPKLDHPRGYHATAVLLPDASVAVAGNTDAYNPGEPNRHDDVTIQVYKPPYLTAGPRPVVAGVPKEIGYGSTIRIDTSGGPPAASVMMMRPCAVTHSVDMDQRAIRLQTAGGAGTVTVKIPTDRSLAPPGHYMLFFLSALGVPSTATFVKLRDAHPTFPPLYLGTYSGDAVIEEVFDGDLTLEKIDQGCKVTLESRHGSITIKHKIDQHSYANLKAATTVSIGEGIDQHSIVEVVAGGDVTIGQKINEQSQATITSTSGKIEIGQKVDNDSEATLIAGTTVHIGQTLDQHSNVTIQAQGDVTIDEMIDQSAIVDITSFNGAIHIGQKIQNGSFATLAAGTTVSIGQKLDQHANVTITAQSDVQIGQKIDQHVTATITSGNGSINIGQGLSGDATATLIALNGDINIGDSIDAGSTLNWNAKQLNCPHQDGTINHL
jgi:hypothetical protein